MLRIPFLTKDSMLDRNFKAIEQYVNGLEGGSSSAGLTEDDVRSIVNASITGRQAAVEQDNHLTNPIPIGSIPPVDQQLSTNAPSGTPDVPTGLTGGQAFRTLILSWAIPSNSVYTKWKVYSDTVDSGTSTLGTKTLVDTVDTTVYTILEEVGVTKFYWVQAVYPHSGTESDYAGFGSFTFTAIPVEQVEPIALNDITDYDPTDYATPQDVTDGVNEAMLYGDGKTMTIWYAGNNPAAALSGRNLTEYPSGWLAGDTLFDTTADNKPYVHNGTSWGTGQTFGSAAIGALTAGHIATGTLSADRIAANSITAGKLYTGAVEADKITAANIATGSLTSASGVFGTIDASEVDVTNLDADNITAGTLDGIVVQETSANALERLTIQDGDITLKNRANTSVGFSDIGIIKASDVETEPSLKLSTAATVTRVSPALTIETARLWLSEGKISLGTYDVDGNDDLLQGLLTISPGSLLVNKNGSRGEVVYKLYTEAVTISSNGYTTYNSTSGVMPNPHYGKSHDITFPIGRFSGAPNVMLTYRETNPAGTLFSVSNISSSGCTIWIRSTSAPERNFDLTAIEY